MKLSISRPAAWLFTTQKIAPTKAWLRPTRVKCPLIPSSRRTRLSAVRSGHCRLRGGNRQHRARRQDAVFALQDTGHAFEGGAVSYAP